MYFIGARFSSQKLKIPGWANSIQVHEENHDSNEESHSHQNLFLTEISDSDVFIIDNNETQDNTGIRIGVAEVASDHHKSTIATIKDSLRRTQSSPSTHDSGFINDSYVVSSSVVYSDQALDKTPYLTHSSSQESISKQSQCSCSHVEGREQEKEIRGPSGKRVSFKKQREVATLTDSAEAAQDIHPSWSHNVSIDEDFIEDGDNDSLTHRNTIKRNEESEVS